MATLPEELDPSLIPPAAPPPEYQPLAVPPPVGETSMGGILATAVGTPQQPLPPIDPNTYENVTADAEVARITSQDSPYMQVARTTGLQTANRRGLLNSSIAAGASQAEAIRAAAPLALSNAQIAGARDLERLQSHFAGERQALDIEARERMLAAQLTNEQLLQTRDIAARLQMQDIDLTNQRNMQQAQIAATRQLTQMNIDAEMQRLNRQLTAQEEAQIREISAQQARLATQIASNEKIATEELANRLEIAELDAKTRTQMNELNNLTQQQTATLNYYLTQDQIYAQSLVTLYNNPDIPAPARQDALNQLIAMKNAGVDLPAAVFGENFEWPAATQGGTVPLPNSPVPTTPTGTLPPPSAPAPNLSYSQGGSWNNMLGLQQEY